MKQLTVITRDQPDAIPDITAALAEARINIEDIEAEHRARTGVIVLKVDHYDRALRTLKDAGFQAVSQDALVVRLEDQPGSLATVALRFKAANVSLRSMHIIDRGAGYSLVSIVTDDNERAVGLVTDVLVSGWRS